MTVKHDMEIIQETPASKDLAIRTAVILAAGMGVRLKERTRLMPKSFVCLGEKTILEESMLRLLDVGIERIVIVTGHLSEQFDPLQARYRETVELVYNPHFADSGTLYSLYCARHLVHGSFLLLEADLVYEQRALRVCLEYPSENILLLSGFSNTSDEYFVETLDGNLLNISKDRKSLGSEVRGEMVGISKISFSMYSLMLETAEERFRVTRHLGYEMDWLISVAPDIPISCPLVDDLVWCEIDDETQYNHAHDTIYPVVSKLDLEREMRNNDRQRGLLSKFKTVGFGAERNSMIQHIRDFYETTNRHEIRACIMFGTLLGKLRHNDFIPWDDDVDIVIFDFEAFLESCAPELEKQGYTIEPDIRDGKRTGCRIFRDENAKVPGRPRLRFPWIGIYEHEIVEDGMIVLPPEKEQYRPEDFLPLKRTDFLGISVGIPQDAVAILNTNFGSDDWMEVCQLPYRNHRTGNEPTGFPDDKFELQTVLDYLDIERLNDPGDPLKNESE